MGRSVSGVCSASAVGMECIASRSVPLSCMREACISAVVMGISLEDQCSFALVPLCIFPLCEWLRVTQRWSGPAKISVSSSNVTFSTGLSPCGYTLVTVHGTPFSSNRVVPGLTSPMFTHPSGVARGVSSRRGLPVPISMASMMPALSWANSRASVWCRQGAGLVVMPLLPAAPFRPAAPRRRTRGGIPAGLRDIRGLRGVRGFVGLVGFVGLRGSLGLAAWAPRRAQRGPVGCCAGGDSRVRALWAVVKRAASVYHGTENCCQFLSLSVTRPAFVPAGRVFFRLSLSPPLTADVVRSPLCPPISLFGSSLLKGGEKPAPPPRCPCAGVIPGTLPKSVPVPVLVPLFPGSLFFRSLCHCSTITSA